MNIIDVMAFLAMEEPLVHYFLLRTELTNVSGTDACSLIGSETPSFTLSIGKSFAELSIKVKSALIVREFLSLFLGHSKLRLPTNDGRSRLAKRLAAGSLMVGKYDLPAAELPKHFDLPDGESAEFYYDHLKDDEQSNELPPDLICDNYLIDEITEDFAAFCPSHNTGRLQSLYGHLLGSKNTVVNDDQVSVEWRKILQRFSGSILRQSDYKPSFKTYNRRFGFPIPGRRRRNRKKVHVVIDTSASNEVNFNRILNELTRLTRLATVVIYQCDTKLTGIAELGRTTELAFVGLGGTQLRPAVDAAIEAGAKQIVVMTDGQCDRNDVINSGAEIAWVIFNEHDVRVE